MRRGEAESIAAWGRLVCAIGAAACAPHGWHLTVFFALACVTGFNVVHESWL